jgi:uncharacterized membrane protein
MELPEILGIAWYELEDFAEIKALMKDGHLLPATYSLWRLQAEAAERKFRRQGHKVTRAHIRPAEFAEWCRARGLDVDAKGRMAFASFVAKEVHTDDDGTRH